MVRRDGCTPDQSRRTLRKAGESGNILRFFFEPRIAQEHDGGVIARLVLLPDPAPRLQKLVQNHRQLLILHPVHDIADGPHLQPAAARAGVLEQAVRAAEQKISRLQPEAAAAKSPFTVDTQGIARLK